MSTPLLGKRVNKNAACPVVFNDDGDIEDDDND